MKKLIGYFLQGLLYITPIAVTIYAIIFSFTWIDDLLRDLVIFQEGGILENFSFPGLGIIILVMGVTLIGFVGQRLISAPLISLVEGILDKTPVIKVIYTSVKDLMSAFVGKDRKFDQPVIVRLDANNIVQRMGFITNSDLAEIGLPDKMSVYFPSSYGVLGELLIVPKENVTPIDANNTDVMKFIISGGVTKIK